MPHDIVYILKEDIVPEELRYSLRSVEKNFPHRNVWFIGGMPKGFKPDRSISHKQTGTTKWGMIKSSMWKAIECSEISEEFFLFNDDFFVLKKFKGDFVNYSDGTLQRRIDELHHDLNGLNPYARTLLKAQQELISLRCSTVNFDVHLPMLVDKQGMRKALKLASSPQMRSLYGNINNIPYVYHADVKEYSQDKVNKDADFLSTDDKTFRDGKVGEFIRASFRKPSRFEVD